MSKKYLVTGASGFVGACIVRRLISNNEDVHVIARRNSENSRLKDISHKISIHYTDLNNEIEVKKLLQENSFNVIFHLATYGGYNYQKDIDNIINTNLNMTWNLFKCCKDSGIEMFINTSSSSEYGEKNEPMNEDMRVDPNNMYGATKAASTILCSTYSKINKIPLVTYRLLSPYGNFDADSRLIPTVIKACLKNENICLGSKNSKRDFIYIDDVVDAYINWERLPSKYGEVYNIGSGIEYSVEEIVNKILYLTKSSSKLSWGNNLSRQYEPQTWVSNIDKIKNDLGFSPKIDIDLGLLRTIRWYRDIINID